MDSAHGSQEFIGTGNELFIVSRSTLAVATLLIVCPAGTCPFRIYPKRAYPHPGLCLSGPGCRPPRQNRGDSIRVLPG